MLSDWAVTQVDHIGHKDLHLQSWEKESTPSFSLKDLHIRTYSDDLVQNIQLILLKMKNIVWKSKNALMGFMRKVAVESKSRLLSRGKTGASVPRSGHLSTFSLVSCFIVSTWRHNLRLQSCIWMNRRTSKTKVRWTAIFVMVNMFDHNNPKQKHVHANCQAQW